MALVSDIGVRDATADDALGIARVRTRTWQVAYAHIFPPEQLDTLSEERSTELLDRVIADLPPRTHMLVVDGPRCVVGFAFVGPTREEAEAEDPERVGELFSIYVLPELSGRRIGQALMVEALSRLRAERFSEAILWVLEDNPRTRRFYEFAGWRPDGGFKDEEWLSTLVREVRYRIAFEAPT